MNMKVDDYAWDKKNKISYLNDIPSGDLNDFFV